MFRVKLHVSPNTPISVELYHIPYVPHAFFSIPPITVPSFVATFEYAFLYNLHLYGMVCTSALCFHLRQSYQQHFHTYCPYISYHIWMNIEKDACTYVEHQRTLFPFLEGALKATTEEWTNHQNINPGTSFP